MELYRVVCCKDISIFLCNLKGKTCKVLYISFIMDVTQGHRHCSCVMELLYFKLIKSLGLYNRTPVALFSVVGLNIKKPSHLHCSNDYADNRKGNMKEKVLIATQFFTRHAIQ